MAKNLRTSPPSSSVARLLDPVAAARAIQQVSAHDAGPPASPPMTAWPGQDIRLAPPRERLVKREIVLTPEADAVLDQLLGLYRQATRTRLSTSHVIRAMLLSAQYAMDALDNELEHVGALRLPSNARGRDAERRRFEMSLARAFAKAMQHAASAGTTSKHE